MKETYQSGRCSQRISKDGQPARTMSSMAIADAPGGIATASAASIEVAVDTIHTTGERAPALNINATIAAHGQAGSTATAPSVTVSTTCTLSATGTDAHAINVNIVPDGTNATLIDGNITVDVGAGSALFGGSGDGRAIHITRGDAIVISNRGAISALSGVEWRLPVPPSLSATTA